MRSFPGGKTPFSPVFLEAVSLAALCAAS